MQKLKVVSWEGGDYSGQTETDPITTFQSPSGKGVWTSSDKTITRSGQFSGGKLNGEGEVKNTVTKTHYVGELKDNAMHGYGCLVYAE